MILRTTWKRDWANIGWESEEGRCILGVAFPQLCSKPDVSLIAKTLYPDRGGDYQRVADLAYKLTNDWDRGRIPLDQLDRALDYQEE